jgi:hypothetical protein
MFSSALQARMASWSCCRFSGLNDFQSLQFHSVLGTCFRVARIRLRTVFLTLHVGNRLQDALPEAFRVGVGPLSDPTLRPSHRRFVYAFLRGLGIREFFPAVMRCLLVWVGHFATAHLREKTVDLLMRIMGIQDDEG